MFGQGAIGQFALGQPDDEQTVPLVPEEVVVEFSWALPVVASFEWSDGSTSQFTWS